MAFVWKVERVHSVGYTVWSVRESEPGCVQSEREVVSVQWCVCELVCAVCTVAAEPGGRVCAAERRRAVLGAPPTPPLTSPPFPSQPLPLSSPSPAPPSPPSSVCGSGRARRHRGRPSAEGGRRAEGGLGWRPGRKHAGPGGAAAAMCRMSFKVSAAGSGRERQAGERLSCGGGAGPHRLPGTYAGRQGGVGAAPGL